jgi:DNA invertase Pin-like site-specific DNA recombinase
MSKPAKLRCAIYTRKSSEEGLGQEFNSLHAQRESCEAYVCSQAGEGWSLVKTAYDDGGFSGGSMDRPAVKALMADIEAGHIDVVVVYKVDRLTRSLADFARIVEAFDKHSVSFVSITQAFNTTTSMGRLTLNVLLSFAQFEREVTGERIRDKIAASKAKGMWMGGNLPLGYDVRDRQLFINEAEADTVRMMFRRYLELGSVKALLQELERQGVRSKAWTTRAGAQAGGYIFNRGGLFHVLNSRLYLGEIPHKELSYPGKHAPIVDHATFDAVQAKLKANAVVRREWPKQTDVARLKGRVFDEDGGPMSPSFGYGKGGRKYCYYVSTARITKGVGTGSKGSVYRVSAPQLDAVVLDRLGRLLHPKDAEDWDEVGAPLRQVEVRSESLHLILRPETIIDKRPGTLEANDQVVIDSDGAIRIVLGIRPVFRGGRTWLITPQGVAAVRKTRIDATLVGGLRRAHECLAQHNASPGAKLDALLEASSPADSYARMLMHLAFLAPDIQKALVEGRQPPGLTLQQMLDRGIPPAWVDQRVKFGFAA